MTETELAAFVTTWLEAARWDVYPEVTAGPGIADLVAVAGRPRRGWIIECKTSLSFTVLEQAYRWRNEYGHYVSIAVPGWRRAQPAYHPNAYARHCIERDGIGILQVDTDGQVREVLPARLNRRPARPIIDQVRAGHKLMGQAGSSSAQRWTPFKETVRALQNWIRMFPGCTMKEAVAGISHHYASAQSARSCLTALIGTPAVPGVVTRVVNGATRLYLEEPHVCPE